MICACEYSEECYSNERAEDYKGTKSITQSGYTCQSWHLDYPHEKRSAVALEKVLFHFNFYLRLQYLQLTEFSGEKPYTR